MSRGRTKGGQPKNQNARKHGFYSAAFKGVSLEKIFRRAQDLDAHQLYDEIVALRTTLFQHVSLNKEDAKVVELLARTLVRAIGINHALTKQQQDGIHDSMIDLLHTLLPQHEGA